MSNKGSPTRFSPGREVAVGKAVGKNVAEETTPSRCSAEPLSPCRHPRGCGRDRASFVAKETKLTADMIHFDKMEADGDAYAVTFSVPTTGNAFSIRVAKKDGNVARNLQQKKP